MVTTWNISQYFKHYGTKVFEVNGSSGKVVHNLQLKFPTENVLIVFCNSSPPYWNMIRSNLFRYIVNRNGTYDEAFLHTIWNKPLTNQFLRLNGKQPRTMSSFVFLSLQNTTNFVSFHRGPWCISHSWRPRFQQILGETYFVFRPSGPECIPQWICALLAC